MSAAVSFEDYMASLSRLSAETDPTLETADTVAIKQAADELRELPRGDRAALTDWVRESPDSAHVLGLALGMSQERLKNTIRSLFATTSIRKVASTMPEMLVDQLDEHFDLVRLLGKQLDASYGFGDVLVARAGSRIRAQSAGLQGRSIEDEIESIADSLGLSYALRTRFRGRAGRTAPCDLAIPADGPTMIAVAAKGFDSTGSKLTDAVREIEDMAEKRTPRQFICAVVDGMGWHSRQADLRRIYDLWDTDQIDGLYTLTSLDRFRVDLEQAARLRDLLA